VVVGRQGEGEEGAEFGQEMEGPWLLFSAVELQEEEIAQINTYISRTCRKRPHLG
jgi:hypothetical protein